MSVIERDCVDCKEQFEINDEEQEYIKKKNYALPKRCVPCRRFKKMNGGDNGNKPFKGLKDQMRYAGKKQ